MLLKTSAAKGDRKGARAVHSPRGEKYKEAEETGVPRKAKADGKRTVRAGNTLQS